MRTMNGCPLCRGLELRNNVFVHEGVAVSSASLAARPGERRPGGDIALSLCRSCGFIFNACFDERAIHKQYTSGSYRVKIVLQGRMSRTLETVVGELSPFVRKNSTVIEIGSGRGEIAGALAPRCGTMITVDPSQAALHHARLRRAVTHYNAFFDASVAARIGAADVIIARHILEHLTQPRQFLELIDGVLSPNGVLYLELPHMDEIARSGRYYDIFHDHFGYYTKACLENVCALLGLSVQKTIYLHQRQHVGVFFRKNAGTARPRSPGRRSARGTVSFARLRRRSAELNRYLRKKEISLAVYGAGAHGVTLWDYLDENARSKVVRYFDNDPAKQGAYIPGTSVRVSGVSPETTKDIPAIVVAASLYEDEICAMLRRLPFTGIIIKTAREFRGVCRGRTGAARRTRR